MLMEWGLDELSDVTELLVSELITNAVVVTQALKAPLPSRFACGFTPPGNGCS
jgi:hypothetical protein